MFDLVIAKMEWQIQAAEAPNDNDNIFVDLGTFYIELAFFSVIGKYIAESGTL